MGTKASLGRREPQWVSYIIRKVLEILMINQIKMNNFKPNIAYLLDRRTKSEKYRTYIQAWWRHYTNHLRNCNHRIMQNFLMLTCYSLPLASVHVLPTSPSMTAQLPWMQKLGRGSRKVTRRAYQWLGKPGLFWSTITHHHEGVGLSTIRVTREVEPI